MDSVMAVWPFHVNLAQTANRYCNQWFGALGSIYGEKMSNYLISQHVQM